MDNQKDSKNTEEYKIQDQQYQFPYHYIPYFDSEENGNRIKILVNGFEYLCYIRHVVEIVKKVQREDKERILEIGCGDGRILNFLGERKNMGVDLSLSAILFARAFNPNISFIHGDANDVADTFSIVLAIEVLEHIPDEIIPQFWKTLYDKCDVNGTIIISVPSVNKKMVKKHFRHYDQKRLHEEISMAELDNNLEIMSLEYIYKETMLIKIWKRFTSNRYWIFEINYIRKKIWKYIWKHLRIAENDTGYHLIVKIKKVK